MAVLRVTTNPAPVTIDVAAPPRVRRLAGGWRTTPGKLRAARAILVALCLVAGAVGVYSARARSAATTEIDRRTGPLSADAIDVYRSLAAADASVTGEFLLAAGPDQMKARKGYDDAVRAAANGLAHAGSLVEDQGLTATRIAAITAQLPVYTGLVGQARALGTPEGLSSLQEASALMQSTILRRAEALQRSESRHLAVKYRRAGSLPAGALTACVTALVALACIQFLLFRRTHRLLNVGLVASSALVVGALVWSATALSISHRHLESSRRHSQSVTDALGPAQIAALQGRANEMLSLVVSGEVTSYEGDFSSKAQLLARDDGAGGALGAARRLAPDPPSRVRVEAVVAATRAWLAAHRQVTALREAGRKSEAVASATGGGPAGAGAAFTQVDELLGAAVQAQDRAFGRDVRLADGAFAGLVLGVGLLALVAAAAALWGVGQRLEEYR